MPRVKVLGIAGSPRAGGNSETLLDWVLESARAGGADVEKARVRELEFSPCVECGYCARKGECALKDDMQTMYPKVLAADWVIIATPVFFMSAPARLKAFIDRFQCIWSRKYLLKTPIRDDARPHRGAVLAVGGTKGASLFNGLDQVLGCFFSILDIEFVRDASIYVRSVDARGDMEKRAEIKELAAALGARIAGTAANDL